MTRIVWHRVVLLIAAVLTTLTVSLTVVSVALAAPSSNTSPDCDSFDGSRVVYQEGSVKAIGRVSCDRGNQDVELTVTISADKPGGNSKVVNKKCNQTKVCQVETPLIKAKKGFKYSVGVFVRYNSHPNGPEKQDAFIGPHDTAP